MFLWAIGPNGTHRKAPLPQGLSCNSQNKDGSSAFPKPEEVVKDMNENSSHGSRSNMIAKSRRPHYWGPHQAHLIRVEVTGCQGSSTLGFSRISPNADTTENVTKCILVVAIAMLRRL